MANLIQRFSGASPVTHPTLSTFPNTERAGAEQAIAADSIALQRVDEAGAIPRPDVLGADSWVEREYDELEHEQGPQWDAAGIEHSRPAEMEAAGLTPARLGDERIVVTHTPVLEAAAQQQLQGQEALAPFRRRSGGKWIHYGIKAALVVGDAVGVTLLGINIGDMPLLAGLMSISAATAAVTSGLVGAEYRARQEADRRQLPADDLTEAQRRYSHFFSGAGTRASTVKLMTGVAATAAGLIGAAICAGRAEVEGPLVGALYGSIALAVAFASFIESYMYADPVADHLDSISKAYDNEIKRHQHLSGAVAWRTQLMRQTEAESIVREHSSRGQAARDRVRSLKWSILRRNPGVMGHGPGSPAQAPVGRTARKSEGDAR